MFPIAAVQIILEKQTFFSRVPHSGGTSVSSAGFFFEYFGKITLEHSVSIVTGLTGFRSPNFEYFDLMTLTSLLPQHPSLAMFDFRRAPVFLNGYKAL